MSLKILPITAATKHSLLINVQLCVLGSSSSIVCLKKSPIPSHPLELSTALLSIPNSFIIGKLISSPISTYTFEHNTNQSFFTWVLTTNTSLSELMLTTELKKLKIDCHLSMTSLVISAKHPNLFALKPIMVYISGSQPGRNFMILGEEFVHMNSV